MSTAESTRAGVAGSECDTSGPTSSYGRIIAASLVAAGTAYASSLSGWWGGIIPLTLLAALLVLAPTHERLVHRLSINIALLVGWAPLLWWVSWPLPLNHAGVILAVLAAGVATAGLRGTAVVPQVTLAEGMTLALSAATACVAVSPWLLVRTPRDALLRLVPAVDNASHFDMFWMLRHQGAVPEAVPLAPDGSAWQFASYPKGSHAVAATVSEVLAPHLSNPSDALVVFLHSEAVVVVLGIVMVVGTLLGVHSRGQGITLPLLMVAVALVGLLWEPGQKILADGFAPFWLGAVAAGTVLVIPLSRREPSLADVAAVAGLLVLVSHTWLPLVAFTAPSVIIVIGSRWRSPWRRSDLLTMAVMLAGGLASLKAVMVLFRTVPVSNLVDANGGYDAPALAPVALLLLTGCWALLLLGSSTQPSLDRVMERWRAYALLATPFVAVSLLVALFVVQVSRTGATAYYFVKLLTGFEVILVVLVPALLILLLGSTLKTARFPTPFIGGIAAAALAAPAITAMPLHRPPIHVESRAGTAGITRPFTREGVVDGILAAAKSVDSHQSLDVVYLGLGRNRVGEPFYPDSWFHALTSSWTERVSTRAAELHQAVDDTAEVAGLCEVLLREDPELRLLVPLSERAGVVRALDDSLADRVITFPASI